MVRQSEHLSFRAVDFTSRKAGTTMYIGVMNVTLADSRTDLQSLAIRFKSFECSYALVAEHHFRLLIVKV
jgi:hypothetical protein